MLYISTLFNYTRKYFFFSIILSLFVSCDSSEVDVQESESSDTKSSAIIISTKQFENSKMVLAKVSSHAFHQSIKTYGVFDVPPENKASVSAYFGGYVKELSLLEGQKVEKGELLFTLENPEYIEIQQEFLEVKGQLDYLKSDYERQKNLAEDNITSQKVYLKAEAEYKTSLVRFESMKKKLALMNLNPNTLTAKNIKSEIVLTSPLSGYITSVHATRGMYLNPDNIALTIINPDHMHLELNIFEKDLPKIKVNQKIRFKLQNDSHKEFDAYVYLVGKFIDQEKRSAAIHGHLSDELDAKYFTPGMYIEADIFSEVDTLMAIEQSAIIKVETSNYVLVKMELKGDKILFEKREVLVGQSRDGFTEIRNTDDFSLNDEILIEGAFNMIGE